MVWDCSKLYMLSISALFSDREVGQSLAVAFSNHIMILANVSTGKVMHQLDCSIQSRFPFSCLGWGVNFTDIAAVRKRVEMSSEAVGLDDLLRNRSDGKILHETPDLPADLAFLDVDSCLPKLSTLVSSGGESVPLNGDAA